VSALNTTLFDTGAPFFWSTHDGSAVAGVQKLSCQHWPDEFFQTSPDELRQLSLVWAEATPDAVMAAKATARAILEVLIMVLLVSFKLG
jgi:hypothetical protein